MIICPHCGEPIEVSHRVEVPWYQRDLGGSTRASLGCGTFIIIAIIVAVFSSSGDNREVREDLRAVENKLDRLSQESRDLQREIRRLMDESR